MAYSYIRYAGNGSTTNYVFSFPYISADHIQVRVNGTLTTLFSFLNSSTVQMTSAPASGAILEIRRVTPKDTAIVNFTDGSVLLERDLDLLATFDLYLAQETKDGLDSSIQQDSLGAFDALSKRIVNVADPVDAQDAATKTWSETGMTAQLSQATAQAVASAASATAASGSAFAAAASASGSATSASNAATSATGASTSATAASGSATAAANSATAAGTSATNANTSAVASAASASSAGTSATNAASSASAAAASYDSFDDRYLGAKSAAPGVDNDGQPLIIGTIYWDTPSAQMFTWNGSSWRPTFVIGNTVRTVVTTTAGQTVVAAPTYLVGSNTLQVFVNGIKVLLGTDYTETTQNSITFASGLGLNDEVELIAQQAFAADELRVDLASATSGKGAALVAFKQPGTGSVPRTVDAKLKEFVSIKDFGVVGDGVADDTAAIQAAINALGVLGRGKLMSPAGQLFKITNTLDFSPLGNTHSYYEIDFGGATFTWHGPQTGGPSLFSFYANKAVTVRNFTLICNTTNSISATVKGIKIDSLQPDGADLLVFSSFRVRLANICIDLGSTTGGTQNRVSDSRFEQFLLEGSTVGVQTNSTNCDSLVFANGQLSGCATGFNFVRAGFNEIETCIGYACDPFIRVAGPIGPLTVINTQSEEGGLTNPAFFYRKVYDNARTGTISFVSCNIDNKIFLDYDPLLGSDAQIVNIIGGYFREMAVDCPDTTVNLLGTTQTSGYTFTLNGANTKCFNYGSRVDGTLIDTATPAAYRTVVTANASGNVPLLGNLVLGVSGKGIDFTATPNGSGTVHKELFDDYEEGFFTPNIIGTSSAGTATYSNRVGSYTKVGDTVYFQINLLYSGGTGSGNLRISGLPFTSADNNTRGYGTVAIGYSSIALAANSYATAFVAANSTEVVFVNNTVGGGSISAVAYDVDAEIMISGHYKVA